MLADVGAILLGFVAEVLIPGDVFRTMSGPTSWLVSIGVGLLGAIVGYLIFTLGLGVGDEDIFDVGGPAVGGHRGPAGPPRRGVAAASLTPSGGLPRHPRLALRGCPRPQEPPG